MNPSVPLSPARHAQPSQFSKFSELKALQLAYEERTGYQLVVADVNGAIRMGVPNCDRFPCLKSCRECRESIIREALRTGQVCVDACHQGYCLWGLPLFLDGKLEGGVVVIGSELAIERERGRFEAACAELFDLMSKKKFLAPLEDRPQLPPSVHRFVHRKLFNDLEAAFGREGHDLIHAMKTAELAEARLACDRLGFALEASLELPIDVVRGILGDFVSRARHQFVEAGMDAYACSAEAGNLLCSLSKAPSIESLREQLECFLERFQLLLSARHKSSDDLLIEKATTYLEEHLREDLNRESVAKAVGISPSHFSRLLKEAKGRTFTDLLNQYRIERASSLLVRTSRTLAEIAGESGFCDQSYFSKVFRRYKGQTPARYRESHQV